MKAQVPAAGIALLHTHDNSASYHIECDCSATEHSAKMWIEVNNDKEIEQIEVSFYVNTWTPFWETGFSRIKTAWNVLIKGTHQQEHCLLLSKQSAFNLANIINVKVKELDKK